MSIDEVRKNLADINWALDELPENAKVLHVQVCDTLGKAVQIESGTGYFADGEHSRREQGVRVYEAEGV